jgi:hypothetical protein
VDERAAELSAVHRVPAAAIRSVPGVELLEFRAADLTPLYGLDRGMPGRYAAPAPSCAGARSAA